MDLEYLQNIANSPFITEKLLDRTIARGASLNQRFNSIAGGDYKDLNQTKIESLCKGFYNNALNILKDFYENQAPRLGKIQNLKPEIKTFIDNIDSVYTSLIPFETSRIGKDVLNPRNATRDKDSIIQGIQAPPQKVPSSIAESLWDQFSKYNAIQKNDPTSIVNYYIGQLKKIYNDFIYNCKKTTSLSEISIKQIVKNLGNKKFYKMLEAVENLKNTEKILTDKEKEVAASKTSNSTLPQQSTPSSASATGSSSTAIPNGGNTGGSGTSNNNNNKEEFITIVNDVIDTIINTVKSDIVQRKGFSHELPSVWDAFKESINYGNSEDSEVEPHPEIEGEFLYNFASRYNKFPGGFSIIMGSPHIITFSNGEQINIEVWWNTKRHYNNIIVKSTGSDNKSTQQYIFGFYDTDVSAEMNAQKTFSIKKLIEKANPNNNLIKDPDVINKLSSKTNDLFKALYVTVIRKGGMEFKSKNKGMLSLVADTDGNVTIYNKGVPSKKLSKTEIKELIYANTEESKKWITALDYIDYFIKNPDVKKPVPVEEEPEFKQAVIKLVDDKGYDVDKATLLAKDAWSKIKKLPGNIKTDEIVNIVTKKNDLFTTGVHALMNLGHKKQDAEPYVKTIIDNIEKSKDISSISSEEFIKLLVKSSNSSTSDNNQTPKTSLTTTPTPTTSTANTSPPSPVSAPAGSSLTPANVSAPVSKDDGNTSVSKEPIAPVSNDDKKNEEGDVPLAYTKEIDGKTELVWTNPHTGQEYHWDTEQVLGGMYKALKLKTPSAFIKALKNGELYYHYNNLLMSYIEKIKQEKEKKHPTTECIITRNGNINVWNKHNIIF